MLLAHPRLAAALERGLACETHEPTVESEMYATYLWVGCTCGWAEKPSGAWTDHLRATAERQP